VALEGDLSTLRQRTKVGNDFFALARILFMWFFVARGKATWPLCVCVCAGQVFHLNTFCCGFRFLHVFEAFVGLMSINPQYKTN